MIQIKEVRAVIFPSKGGMITAMWTFFRNKTHKCLSTLSMGRI